MKISKSITGKGLILASKDRVSPRARFIRSLYTVFNFSLLFVKVFLQIAKKKGGNREPLKYV